MIVLQHIKCQFGNILFQLITGSYFAKCHSLDYYYESYDTHEIHFNNDYNYVLNKFKYYRNYNSLININDKNSIELELDFNYKPIEFIENKNYIISGYCQNWNFINYDYALDILKPDKNILNKINEIVSINIIKNSIGIHLRLKEYKWAYENFINDENRLTKFINDNKDKQILIFTDDVPYIKDFDKYDNVIIFSKKSNSFLLDFYALTLCKTLVGGLSTFFIWALYLNLNHPIIYYIKESYKGLEQQFIKLNAPNYIYNDYNFNPSLFKDII